MPSYFIAVALDEGPGPPLRSPYTDLTKLYAVVSILVRCCDVIPLQTSSIPVSSSKRPIKLASLRIKGCVIGLGIMCVRNLFCSSTLDLFDEQTMTKSELLVKDKISTLNEFLFVNSSKKEQEF